MAKFIEQVYLIEFLNKGKELGYGGNQLKNEFLYNLIHSPVISEEFKNINDILEHIRHRFEFEDEEKYIKSIFDSRNYKEIVFNMLNNKELDYIPYFHIFRETIGKYINKLKDGEIDIIQIIND